MPYHNLEFSILYLTNSYSYEVIFNQSRHRLFPGLMPLQVVNTP